MGINLQYVKAWLSTAALCILSIFLSPPGSYASELIYTVQTGSFANEAEAQAEYDFMMNSLNREKLDYLRIEKVGKFYAVRIGKFEDHADTEIFIRQVKSHLSDILVMKAYLKNERVTKIHRASLPLDRHGVKERTAAGADAGKKQPVIATKAANREKAETLVPVNSEHTEVDNLKPPSSLKRDLFSSGRSMDKVKRNPDKKELKNLELKATIIDGQDPLAIIGDEVLGIGGSVEGLKVTAIKNNEVTLSKGGSQYILRMKKE